MHLLGASSFSMPLSYRGIVLDILYVPYRCNQSSNKIKAVPSTDFHRKAFLIREYSVLFLEGLPHGECIQDSTVHKWGLIQGVRRPNFHAGDPFSSGTSAQLSTSAHLRMVVGEPQRQIESFLGGLHLINTLVLMGSSSVKDSFILLYFRKKNDSRIKYLGEEPQPLTSAEELEMDLLHLTSLMRMSQEDAPPIS